VAAAIGYLALARGSVEGLPGPVRLYTVAGVPRLTGTFDYPTIAASVLATALMLAVPLAVERRGWARLIVVGAMVTIGTALLLTLSRGALLGLGAGVVVLVVLAVSARRRPLAVAAAATGGMVAAGAVALAFLGPLPPQRMVMEGDRGLYAARYLVTGHLALAPGERRDVRVTVTNTGLATWSDEGPDAVRLVQRWRLPNAQGSIRRADAPVALPAPVPSGATISLTATVTAPAVMGEMRLAWDMEQGRMGGFSERAVPVAVTEVLVTTAPATRVEGEDPAATELLYPGLMLEPTRGELWHAAVAIAAERPLLGSGPGTFRRIYGAYLGWSRWDPQVHSNSLYLEMAATTGVVGLIACLLLIAALVAPQVRSVIGRAPPGTPDGAGGDRRGLDPRRAGLVAAFVAATAVALAHGLVDVFLAFLPTAILFWGVLGVGLGLALGGESRRARVTA
jgi:O-antigen ligase